MLLRIYDLPKIAIEFFNVPPYQFFFLFPWSWFVLDFSLGCRLFLSEGEIGRMQVKLVPEGSKSPFLTHIHIQYILMSLVIIGWGGGAFPRNSKWKHWKHYYSSFSMLAWGWMKLEGWFWSFVRFVHFLCAFSGRGMDGTWTPYGVFHFHSCLSWPNSP